MATKPEPVEEIKAPAKGKKMLLVIVVVLLALGLVGGAAWVFVSKRSAAADGDAVAEAEPEHAAEAQPGPPTYLPLESMVVNLADPGGEKVAQLGVTLELVDAKAPEKVRAYLPAIRNGILLLLSQRTSEELLQREGKEKLAADILADASRHFTGAAPAGAADGAKSKKKSRSKSSENESPIRAVLFSSLIVQ